MHLEPIAIIKSHAVKSNYSPHHVLEIIVNHPVQKTQVNIFQDFYQSCRKLKGFKVILFRTSALGDLLGNT
jgi:hypothetical protein